MAIFMLLRRCLASAHEESQELDAVASLEQKGDEIFFKMFLRILHSERSWQRESKFAVNQGDTRDFLYKNEHPFGVR
jgi:hypothetical protein